ncbi:hypothetical protein SBF1_960004 [Candidatus Desulfosporosinus infrequens]|uniref:Uncharacterized protein n=1 Tax=Candidatus Desulfosporosinus infrequens TaxID=2043169 RepID=A0A2U3LYQ2_9FIRM|nr:hypothetical protein SBF1_960004 [Candidatus Desulfosporosinus infrequens]
MCNTLYNKKYKSKKYGYNGVQGGGLLCQSQQTMESLCIVPIVTKDSALDMMLVTMRKKNTLISCHHHRISSLLIL